MNLRLILEMLGIHLIIGAAALLVLSLRERRALLPAVVALAGVAITAVWMGEIIPGASFLPHLLEDIRTARPLVAVALGAVTGLLWFALPILWRRGATGRARLLTPIAATVMLAGIIGGAGAFVYASKLPQTGGIHPSASDPRFLVEAVVSADGDPICVAVDEHGAVYLTIQVLGAEEFAGRVSRLEGDRLRVLADSPVLWRPFGLALHGGALYVSHSGFGARASEGKIEYLNLGTVTRIRDLDGDGYFEFYDDVVTGLPGVQGPATQHQNNAIVFGPKGELYIASGACSDRERRTHPWEGTILVLEPGGNEPTVFADGVRNPFGLAFGPDNELFCTDNDVSLENPGDELNHVEHGKHYGHPFVVGNDDGGGRFEVPLVLSGPSSSYAGLGYTESSALPEEYRGCLYFADFLGNRIVRAELERRGGGYQAKASTFADIPLPIDLAITPSGDMYVTSRNRTIYRIRLRDRGIRN